jgi:hypothetical protein
LMNAGEWDGYPTSKTRSTTGSPYLASPVNTCRFGKI